MPNRSRIICWNVNFRENTSLVYSKNIFIRTSTTHYGVPKDGQFQADQYSNISKPKYIDRKSKNNKKR